MACESEVIPEYLHKNDRPTLPQDNFLDDHRLYRIGNPIEFPKGTITAFSCKWSLLINEEDILRSDDPPLGDDYRYSSIESIKNLVVKHEKTDGNNLGWHRLSCVPIHQPNECDYSHSEVLIKHQIWREEEENNLLQDVIYTYEMWQEGNTMLQNKAAFFKVLKSDYRVEVIKLFCHK